MPRSWRRGELSHRTSISAAGEFGKLADAFNRMASSLERRRNAGLEHANELRQAKNTLDAVIDASPVAIACSDLDRKLFVWNCAAEDIYGYTEAEVLGQRVKIIPPEMTDAGEALHLRACSGEIIRGFETRRIRKDGTFVDVRLAAAPLFAEDGTLRGVAFVHEDITARKKAEEQLRQFAHFDQLTGLANRLTMTETLGRLLQDADRQTSIAILDLDGFKEVNDTLGHSTGDRLLIEVAGRLKSAVASRAPDALACRLGGDEFVIVVPDCGSPLLIAEVVGEALTRLSEPYAVGEHVLQLGGSAGIAIAPLHGSGVDELLSNADLALYRAKKSGGRAYRFFSSVVARQCAIAARARFAIAARVRQRRIRAPLPTAGPAFGRRRHRCRSPAAVAASRARPARPARLHRRARGEPARARCRPVGSRHRPARRRPSGEARDFRSPAWPSICFQGSCTTIR